jgi:glutathione reductase (NADPH)
MTLASCWPRSHGSAIAVAMRAGVTMRQLQSTMAVHPTLGEELVTLRAPTKIYDSQRA